MRGKNNNKKALSPSAFLYYNDEFNLKIKNTQKRCMKCWMVYFYITKISYFFNIFDDKQKHSIKKCLDLVYVVYYTTYPPK